MRIKNSLTRFFSAILVLFASNGFSFPVRVVVLSDASSLESAVHTLSQHEYQGTLRVIPNKRGGYDGINILDVEDFLLGVVGREMDPRDPLEALKAQAIAARSHALYQVSISEGQSFDLVANLSQAYAGKDKLRKNVVLAIEATRSEVIYYGGKPIPTYFHESCGGHTESVESVWQTSGQHSGEKDTSLPPPVACSYCAHSNEYRWKYQITQEKLGQLLQRDGFSAGSNPDISIGSKELDGRVQTVTIQMESEKIQMTADKFRSLLGYSNLRSALFEVEKVSSNENPGATLLFHGNGYGHGVGLCQFGAREMAKKGAKSDEILSHYFPGSVTAPYPMDALAGLK